MNDLTVVYRPLGHLRGFDRNARTHSEAQINELVASIRAFGFVSPILLDEQAEIIAGHGRLEAAKAAGLEQVPTITIRGLSPEQVRALRLADNQISSHSGWDLALLTAELEALKGADFDLGAIGFGEDFLAGLRVEDGALADLAKDVGEMRDWSRPKQTDPANPPQEPGQQPEPEIPEVVEEGPPDSQQGDVYQLGPHRLLCGDCRDFGAWQKLLAEGGRVNVCFTSPPYASQRKYDESSGFKPIPPEEYSDWWEAVQRLVREHLAPDGSFFVNIKEHCEDGERHIYCKELLVRHVREWGWRWVEEYAWTHGGTPRVVVNRFKNGWEPVWHLVLGEALRFRPDAVRHEYTPDQTGTRVESYGGGHPFGRDGLEGQQRTMERKATACRPSSETFKFRPEAVRHEVPIEEIPIWDASHPSQEGGVSCQPGGRNFADCERQRVFKREVQNRRKRKQVGSNAELQSIPGATKVIQENARAHAQETGLAYPCNVLSVGRNREALGHGAAFPVSLPDFFVRAYSDPGDLICDPFMGSGSTMIAAAQNGRRAVGFEISPRYCDVIRRRWTRWAKAHNTDPGPGALEDPRA